MNASGLAEMILVVPAGENSGMVGAVAIETLKVGSVQGQHNSAK